MKVLVTGAHGFIGRQLVPRLLEAGHHVRILVRERGVLHADEVVLGALPDAALCTRICAGMQAVVHAAGVAHVNAASASLRTHNLEAAVELARAARAQGVRTFVFLSSSKARFPAHSAYARFKAEAEVELRKLHQPGIFEVVILRPALVYGRGMRGNLRSLLRLLSRRHLPVFVGSANPLGMISVEDLCRAVIAALTTQHLPAQAWELSDGTRYTLDQLSAEVRHALGLPRPAVTLPRPMVGVACGLAAALSPILRSGLSMSTYRTLFDEAFEPDPAFSQHTGCVPQDSFRSRLPELLEDLARE